VPRHEGQNDDRGTTRSAAEEGGSRNPAELSLVPGQRPSPVPGIRSLLLRPSIGYDCDSSEPARSRSVTPFAWSGGINADGTGFANGSIGDPRSLLNVRKVRP
jgi:hypothetical protein